jgi:hypothetical protein
VGALKDKGTGMTKYRKIPLEIEAVEYLGFQPTNNRKALRHAFSEEPEWLSSAMADDTANIVTGRVYDSFNSLRIGTLEGPLTVSPGDYIIRGIKGELYPCKPDIFAATYELSETD